MAFLENMNFTKQQNQSKSEEKMFNWSEVHLYRSNFLQNPYFNSDVLKKHFALGDPVVSM